MKLANDTEVVISGVGGYFPKAINIEVFKQALFNNENLLESRWPEGEKGISNVVGILPDIDLFDTSYFGIHHEQCSFMDPMQRLVMERTFEALIDAGVSPTEIKGTKVGVYAGSTVGENDNLFYESIISGFGLTGHSRSMMPNRVSYWLNLKGPSCTYDANWLNGTEVLQAAFEAIKAGHCDSAIVATANLVLNSELSWIYNDMGLISPDGVTRSFDAKANGYGRSDGVVALYIQRACDARRSYATIIGVDSYFNGNRDGPILDLETGAMSDFIDKFYTDCRVDPKKVDYVECYGSGQSNIDEFELNAIDRVYCKDRSKPLLVGAVKPNVGHSEASSDLISLVKVLIAMETGKIPATINYESPNPNILPLVEGRIEVVNKNLDWNPDLVAINTIGLASTYGHILLKANPKIKKQQPDGLPKLMAVSTRTEPGIQEMLNLLKSEGKNIDPEYAGLIQGTFKKAIPNHLYRGYVVLDDTEEQKSESEYHTGNKRQTWFVYSGMGSQWCKMACDLMALPIFSKAIYKCHKILEPKGVDLLKIVTEDDDKMFENILHSFVGIAAVQIGLTDVLHALGIMPDGIIGHSVGELGCAYADGCLSAEQMILCAYSRGKASLEAQLIKGMMAALGKGYQQMKDQCPPSIEIACHNGPDSCTISGPTEDMEVFVKELQDKGLFARLVNVSNIAYHSKYIKPAAPLLLKYLQEVIPNPLARSSKWISTSIPEEEWDTDLAKTSSAEYHTNNLLSSVLFEEGSKHIPKESIVIEIAPHGLLQAILKRSLKANCTNVPLTHKTSKNQLNFMLGAIGKLFLAGLDVNIPALYPPVEYPVSRGTKTLTPLIHWEHSERWRANTEYKIKLNYLASVREVSLSLKDEEYRHLVGNQLKSTIIIPTSTYVGLVYDVFASAKAGTKITDVIFEDLYFKNTVSVPRIGNVSLYVMIHKGTGGFEISSDNEFIGSGVIKAPELAKMIFTTATEIDKEADCLQLNGSDVYSEFYHRGHKYGGVYKAIKNLKLSNEGCVSSIQWDNNWSHLLEGMFQQCLFIKGERNQNTLTVSRVQRIALSIPLLPAEPGELEATYHYATEMIYNNAIQISGVGVNPLTLANRPISYDSVELTSLNHISYKNIESGINLCLHLVIENFEGKDPETQHNSVMVVEIVTENPVFENNIRNVVDKYTSLIANISSVKDPKKILISQAEPLLVILNDKAGKDCISLLTTHAFLLAQTDEQILSYPEITQVVQFVVNGISYSLIRKSSKAVPVIVPIKADTLTSKDLARENLPWVSKLKSVVASVEDKSNVYLVSTVVPFEGILNFVQDIHTLPHMHKIRFVFILDKKAPEFTTTEPSYQKVFKDNIKLTVVKNGSVGSYVPIPVAIKEGISYTLQTTSNIVENIRLDYLGVNVRDETLMLKGDHKPELGNIDYSGVTSSGEKIMGLARLNTEFCKLVPDPVLQWTPSKRWSLEDAVTVPHAYCMAYYALVIVGQTNPGETVLVHGGGSAFGLAAISIASNLGCTIFTTVTSDKQKAFMKKQFCFLGDRNIFNACNTSFEPHLMAATRGQGAHVILNCLSGSLLNATLRCVADFGKIIQIGKFDLEENSEIGMRIFLRNVSIGSLTMEDIFDAPLEIKQRLHDAVLKGMQSLIVRPLRRAVVGHQNIESILRTLKHPEHVGKMIIKLSDNLELGQLNINNSSQFICDPKNAYLIYGGSSEMWIDAVQWLIFRGARKIVVSSESKALHAHINRRLMLFKRYFDAEIIFAAAKSHTRDSALELISEVYRLGPIGAVFVLPNKNSASRHSEIKAVQFLDSAVKATAPKALFINFLTNAAGICQLRMDAGFPTHNVHWEHTLEFSDALYALDDMLQFNVKDIFVKDDLFKDDIHETAQSFYKKLSLLLPNSIQQLKEETAGASAKPDFIQLPSLAPRVIREVAPVFVVPGMFGREAVKDLATQLMCPVFCANFPNEVVELEKTAAHLAERMKAIYPRGPYNIIAISYGGVLAIEIAKLLERSEASTHLIFIDAAPHSIQGILKHLGKGSDSEVGLVCRLLDLTSPDTVKNLSNLSDWDARLMYALQQYPCSLEDKYYLKKTLTVLKKYFDEISAYHPSEELVVGSVSLLRPSGSHKSDACGLYDYCKETAQIFLVDGDHLSIVRDKATITFLNNKVMC